MNSENRAKLIERIQTLEGLTDDERSALLELLRSNKQYGLVWENKPEDVEERLREELPVLTEDESKRLISENPDAPNHILIEGDNLEALTTLAYTHAGEINVIYIDPPYNTGKKDFTYYDDFCDEYRTLPYVDKEDAYRHSKWLSFMNRRLKIAKKLLSDDGAIFISIDDREASNLKLLCDEIFGFERFITMIPRVTKLQRAAQEKHMDVSHDYVLCYSKGEDFRHIVERDFDESKIKKDHIGTYIVNDTKAILADKSKGYSAGGDYDFEYNGTIYSPVDKNGNRNRWLWTKARMEAAAKLGILVETGHTLRMQLYLDVKFDDKTNTMVPRDTSLILHSVDLMTDSKITNAAGSKALKELGQDLFANFNNPKPIELIKKIVQLYDDNSCTILDFFAGSGTTLHAIMQLNTEDGGCRKCILVTNNENGICEKVTYERNKRVIEGYTKSNGDFVEGLKDNNLRYYRTNFVSRSRAPQNLRKLVRLATDMLCIKEDLYEEKKEFAGQETIPQVFRYFEKGNKRMMVIYREEAVPLLIPLIEQYELPEDEKIHVYVFSPSEDPWAGDFEDVQEKVELCALPMAIFNAYKRVLPKRKDQIIYVEPDMLLVQTEEENKSSDTLFPEEGGDQ